MIKKINSHLFENGLEYYYIKKKSMLNITIEVWVKVGSANELPHEYGICHMIEHMIFKGSEKIELGVLDTVFYLMSGKTNAYTSKDFTVYTFTVPKNYFSSLLDILFDLFEDPRFDEIDLMTEKDVVLQEIQMYEDDSYSKLFDEAFLNSKSKYNYQHEILGNKKTVNSFSEKQLYDFYQKYYILKNMKFFIIGDLSFNKIHSIVNSSMFAEKAISNNIINDLNIIDNERNNDIKKVNYIYTETLNKHFLLTYLFPVCTYDKSNLFKALNLLLGGGKDSLLYQKLHIELQLVTDIRSFFHGLYKETYFFIYFNPINFSDISLIITHIYSIIDSIVNINYDFEKLEKIENILNFQHALLLTENSDDFIAQNAPYSFEKKRNFLLYKSIPLDLLKRKISKLAYYFKHDKSIINAILPYEYNVNNKMINQCNLNNESNDCVSININCDKNKQNDIDSKIQNDSYLVDLCQLKKERKDQLQRIFDLKLLKEKNSLPKYVDFLPFQEYLFQNGLKVIIINDKQKSNIVSLIVSLKVKNYYDDENFLGGIAFLFDWMYEGTLNFKNTKFIEIIEKYGIDFIVNIGSIEIKCLKKYIDIAINLLFDFLKNPEFALDRFELLKMQTIDSIKNFMDDASSVGLQKIRELVYKDHPYAKNPSGTIEIISKFTPEFIKGLYNKYISPDNALLFFIGDVNLNKIIELIEGNLKGWKNKEIVNILFPNIKFNNTSLVNYHHINKEQVVIFYGGLSAKKYSKDFYYLLLADQLLSSSMTDSMYSILFQIRDKSGMFYDISGSLVSGCGHENGMIIIRAMTDKNNLARAIKNIDNVIKKFISLLTKEDIYIAKKSLLLSMAEKNDSQSSILNCFLNKYRYNLSDEDFKNNYNIIKKASLKEIKNTLKKYFNRNQLELLIVGKSE